MIPESIAVHERWKPSGRSGKLRILDRPNQRIRLRLDRRLFAWNTLVSLRERLRFVLHEQWALYRSKPGPQVMAGADGSQAHRQDLDDARRRSYTS